MIIQSTTLTNYLFPTEREKLQKKNHVSFGATPKQILDVLETARICPGKKGFLGQVAGFFDGLQGKMHQIAEAPAEYVYRLGQKNDVPEALAKTEVGGLTLRRLDDALNHNPFECKPGATCGCGGGMTKGNFAKQLLEIIGVNEPEVIKIAKRIGGE